MSTHYVYELLNRDGQHLYIGCTSDIASRLSQHRSEREWYGEITRIEVDAHPNQRSGLDAERELIEQYQPIHNHVFTDGHDAGGWRKRMAARAERHEAGLLCEDTACRACKDRAHALGVGCSAQGWRCPECRGRAPWWSSMTAEQRKAHPDYDPFWDAFLDHNPTGAELVAFFGTSNLTQWPVATRRRSA